jgi:hypothetical protein
MVHALVCREIPKCTLVYLHIQKFENHCTGEMWKFSLQILGDMENETNNT